MLKYLIQGSTISKSITVCKGTVTSQGYFQGMQDDYIIYTSRDNLWDIGELSDGLLATIEQTESTLKDRSRHHRGTNIARKSLLLLEDPVYKISLRSGFTAEELEEMQLIVG